MSDSGTVAALSDEQASLDEAFQSLADDTRLAILKAMWEAYDPMNPEPIPFSDLRKRVEVDDPGRFNYHLGKLTSHFIRRTEDGYEFREAGKRIMRVVISGTAVDSVTIDSTEIDVACIFCGGQTAIEYEDGLLSHRCIECSSRCVADYPPSLLSQAELPAAGLLDRETDEVYASNQVWIKHREASVMDGVCPECSGPMPVDSIRICDDHQPNPTDEDVCDSCGSIFWGLAHHVCEVCKFHMQLPTSLYPPTHPAVLAFYHEHGIEFDLASHEDRRYVLDYEQEVVSEDPLRIRTTVPLDGDQLAVEFDDQMQVTDVRELSG